MKNKTFRGSERKLDKIEEYNKHFGWETFERDDTKLVMSFDSCKPHAPTLRKLQKQANIIRSKFPFKMIPWLVIGIIFFVLFLTYKDGVMFGALDLNSLFGGIFTGNLSIIASLVVNLLPILFICLFSLNFFFAAYVCLVFLAVKLSKHRTLEEIYRVADAISGNVIDAPFECNIEPDGPYTGFIAKIAHKIGNRS